MRRLAQLAILLFATGWIAQAQSVDAPQAKASSGGVVPLVQPYAISTAPHFAVLIEFPKADSIRRIALGDSNYFLAEADKDDPHYAIVKQIRASGEKAKSAIQTNMLVYMASGQVINIMLKAGKLADTAYLIDYPVHDQEAHNPVPLQTDPEAIQRAKLEQARSELAGKMLDEVKSSSKKTGGIAAGGVTLRPYATERLDEVALVSFDIENTSPTVVDLEAPQVNLITEVEKGKERKKGVPAKVEPVQLIESRVSAKQLPPGGRAVCLIALKPPVHDSDQHLVLSVRNRAMADQPATFRIE